MHGVPIAPGVVSEHGWAAGFLDDIRGPAPQNNRNTALTVLLLLGEGVHPVLPFNVHIPTEGKKHPVSLREVNLIPSGCIQKSQLTRRPKGHTHCDVLIFCTLRVEGRTIVVEGFPVGGVCVPIETRAHTLHLNVEIIRNLFFNHLEGWGGTRVLGDQVSALMPRDPFCLPTLSGLLYLSHLVYEFVV